MSSSAKAAALAVTVAEKVTALAEDALKPLEVAIKGWRPEFRAIVWTAVSELAGRLRDEAGGADQ